MYARMKVGVDKCVIVEAYGRKRNARVFGQIWVSWLGNLRVIR